MQAKSSGFSDIKVVSVDGKTHFYHRVPTSDVIDLCDAVMHGRGFVVKDTKDLTAYGPGQIARVSLIKGYEE